MRTREFLDQSVFLTAHFEVVVAAAPRLPEAALQRFWVASRSRFEAWGTQLRRCTEQLDSTNYAVDRLWLRWTPLLEEVLIGEIVTRLWAYLLEAVDDRIGVHEYAPIGQSAFRAHLDARRRVLNLILRGRQRGLPAVCRLNQQRLSAERWTDLLLSQAEERSWLGDYAFDAERVRRLGGFRKSRDRQQAILRLAGQAAFADCALVPAAHVDYHTRIHEAILGCYGHELFQGDGPILSGWQARMLALTEDTQGLLDDWLNESPVVDKDRYPRDTLPRF